jgi:hypothetical protein
MSINETGRHLAAGCGLKEIDMKHLKTLILAAVAAAAVTAVAGADAASATVLCKTTTTPCSSPYAAGTIVVPSLTGSNTLETLEGINMATCLQTNIKTKIEKSGSATSTVYGPNLELAAANCTVPTITLSRGALEIHHISGTDDGTVTGLLAEVTVNTSIFGSCVYGAGTGVDIGTLFGGESPIIKVNGIVKRVSGICPNEARWTGEYKVTEPKPLYVEPS